MCIASASNENGRPKTEELPRDVLSDRTWCQSNVSIFPNTPFDKLIARGAEPKRCLNSRDKPSFTLCERPCVDWKLLNAIGDRWPAQVNTVSNYLARLASSGNALLTDYTPRSIDDKGRHYCVQVGAQINKTNLQTTT